LNISLDAVKLLRDQTGAGIMDCKKALEDAGGDTDKAVVLLLEKGVALAAKKSDRETGQGLVQSYIHQGGKVAALVEVNCETDFVARTDEFQQLVYDLAMQIAAMAPAYISGDEIPEDSDPLTMGTALMDQDFIKDSSKTVRDLINETVGKVGENIRVRRFVRYALGS
jgi:elongation factor Ts